MLSIRDLKISYDKESIIENLSLAINSGTFIGLIGPNGAGKTTLLLSISGQFKPQKGNIVWKDKDIYEHNIAYKRNIGYVHENPFFYSYLNAEEYLHFVARVKKLKNVEQISRCLNAVNLYEERNKLTSQLSQGMKKKLAIAAALLGEPQIIFLDEALNGIDVESAFMIKNVLKEYVKNGGTVILSTHVLEVIEKISDRYIIIKNGKIISDLMSKDLPLEHSNGIMDLEKHVISLLNKD